jgi:glutathione S-transferase
MTPFNSTSAPYVFHAYDVSYFSAKVRPALRYKKLWYEERRADLREIHRRTGLYFIPVLITPEGDTWQDSTDIFDRLEDRHPTPPLFPGSPLQRMAAHLVELYADEFGTLPAMHYRWGSAEREASSRARFSAMTGSRELGNLAADRMVAARLAVGANEATAPVIEAHTHELLDALSTHFEAHSYLLGERMSFADCALMGPFYAHLFVDLESRQLLLDRAWRVVGWIERCNAPNPDQQGEWLSADALAPQLRAVLEVMGRDAAPLILDLVRHCEAWIDQNADGSKALPRAAGKCETGMRGVSFERSAALYCVWSIQRVHAAWRSLSDSERELVTQALASSGWDELLAYTPRHRLIRRGFEHFLEAS